MFRRAFAFAFVLSCSLAFAQLDSNTITVTASKNVTETPDQIVFSVQVSAPPDQTLDDVAAAIAGSGITLSDFSGLSTNSGYSVGTGIFPVTGAPLNALTWQFSVAVPFSQMKAEVTALTTLQKTIVQKNNGIAVAFSIQGTEVSTQLQQSQVCTVADLVAGSSTLAQSIAAAAGFNLGGIVSMSGYSPAAPQCTLTVKFQLLRMS
jgi:hypothetical protein